METRIFKDRVIAYKKDSIYLAISLEFDLLAEGESITQALAKLYDATSGYLQLSCEENEADKEIYRKAPKKYQNIYDLFVELSEKKRKKEADKKKEIALSVREVSSIQLTYNSQNLCNA